GSPQPVMDAKDTIIQLDPAVAQAAVLEPSLETMALPGRVALRSGDVFATKDGFFKVSTTEFVNDTTRIGLGVVEVADVFDRLSIPQPEFDFANATFTPTPEFSVERKEQKVRLEETVQGKDST